MEKDGGEGKEGSEEGYEMEDKPHTAWDVILVFESSLGVFTLQKLPRLGPKKKKKWLHRVKSLGDISNGRFTFRLNEGSELVSIPHPVWPSFWTRIPRYAKEMPSNPRPPRA